MADLSQAEIEELRSHPKGEKRPPKHWAILERVVREEGYCCAWGVLNAHGIGGFNMHSH